MTLFSRFLIVFFLGQYSGSTYASDLPQTYFDTQAVDHRLRGCHYKQQLFLDAVDCFMKQKHSYEDQKAKWFNINKTLEAAEQAFEQAIKTNAAGFSVIREQNRALSFLQDRLEELQLQQTSDSDSEEAEYEGFPTIDLRGYAEGARQPEAKHIDLHPVYNCNPRQYVRQKIHDYQKRYARRPNRDNQMLRFITGTALKRPGPNYTLKNKVKDWLKEPYCQRRIKSYWCPVDQKGIINVILRRTVLPNE